ncbi:hypothetical protein M422DRAFT_256721 [Sphaerobolus stellatus SS14]|uniref:Unplaced genomic scaffold SPHSTscaffold_69, whole genome shotgun sequence n=1 Tax=Sphaerobolus stellatus (strain SS14) TaxID=990650 RepID=A0A0C9VQI2_SPHS4|nr:hypothetical protein M422DRAFT_256721 [Sphaerobolus stellatus SS14]
MSNWALFQALLTESFSILYPGDEAKEQLDLVVFPEDGKASTFFASFEKWKTQTNFGDCSYQRKVLKLILKCLKQAISCVMPKPQTYAKAKAYILQFDQCHWENFCKAVAKAKLQSHLLCSVRAPANMTSSGSLSTPKPKKLHSKGSPFTFSSKSNNNNNNALDEDFSQTIQLHLQERANDGYIRAEDIVDFLSSPEMQKQFPEKKIKITICTAQRWLHKLEWQYRKKYNSMYIDEHEWEDVVTYCVEFLE